MAWYLGGVRIYVTEDTGLIRGRRQAKIEILDSEKTIIHDSGRPSDRREITFWVFSGYYNNILPLIANTSVNLVSDQGDQGNYFIMGEPTPRRIRSINYPKPVFEITMELMKDDS